MVRVDNEHAKSSYAPPLLVQSYVHNAGWWCTTQVGGAQCSPGPLR